MEPPSRHSVTILNKTSRKAPVARLRQVVRLALAAHRIPGGSVSLLITDDGEIQELNRTFRGVDEATDVLTFPAAEVPGQRSKLVGDIAISLDYAERQAAVRQVALDEELCFLAIHGALHLAGFDDESDEDRASMVTAMNDVAEGAGFARDDEWSSILHQSSDNLAVMRS